MTSLDQISPMCDETLEGPMLRRRLHEAGVEMRPRLDAQRDRDRVLQSRWTSSTSRSSCRQTRFVLVTQRRSDDALYRDLRADPDALAAEGIEALYRIGDCVAPRLIADAIFDGHRLGREIDSPDPAVPLPYRRERAIVGSPTPAGEPV